MTGLAAKDQLFTWLNPPATVIYPARLRPSKNALEGGFNAPIKRLVDAHRGITGERLRRLTEWHLLARTKFPPEPVTIAETQRWGATAIAAATALAREHANHERVGTDDIGRPAIYDRGIDTEYTHSIGIQHGWAGRR